MIGVTINNGGYYRPICDEAVRRFKKYTGIQTVVVIDTDNDKRRFSFFTKLRLHTMFPNASFVFFDADLWFIKNIQLTEYDNSESFYACLDAGRDSEVDFPIHDCHVLGIDKFKYFNSGLFIANGRNQKHRDAFDLASLLFQRVKLFDFGEQSVLNAGIQRNNIKLEFLDSKLNYPIICDQKNCYKPEHRYSDEPYAIHALGYKSEEKQIRLQQYLNEQNNEQLQLQLSAPMQHTYRYT